jgi:transcriptional regulator with XRE-family HTH domain
MWNGRRIAQRRAALQMSQEDLAHAIGSSQNQVSRYERGVNVPTGDVLVALADALETTADYLLGRTEDPTRPLRSAADLDDDERQLLEIYRQKSPEKRTQIIDVAKVL